MRLGKFHLFLLALSLGLMGLAVWLYTAQTASAQCGSQASSCKNCHEVQGQDPVNAVGDWHIQHAFIDACVVCHAGNDQATDKDAAHTGMAAPLDDVQAACSRCHPTDTVDKAKVYAAALGVEIGTGGGSSGGGQPGAAPTAAPTPLAPTPGGSTVVVGDQSNVVDYSAQYDQSTGGQIKVNPGDVIVGLLLALVVLGGGAYVVWNERRLRSRPTTDDRHRTTARPGTVPLESYPAEVLELVPLVAALNPMGLHALKRLLQNPEEASQLLHGLARLDPELVRRIRSLDRDSRALLQALAGD